MSDNLPRKTEKPWGYELLYALTEKYAGKIIFIKKALRLSLQYHKVKDESLYLFQGLVLLESEDLNGQMKESLLNPGASIRLPSMTKHRIEAKEDSLLLEVSTPELEDVVRLEDDYGRSG